MPNVIDFTKIEYPPLHLKQIVVVDTNGQGSENEITKQTQKQTNAHPLALERASRKVVCLFVLLKMTSDMTWQPTPSQGIESGGIALRCLSERLQAGLGGVNTIAHLRHLVSFSFGQCE